MPSAKRIRTRRRTPEESSSWGSAAALAIASNDDLLLEILLRLPVKSLLRLKSVSKQWLSLISDPQFIGRKSLQSSPISVLVLNEDGQKLCYDVYPLDGRPPLRSLTFADPDPPYHGMAILSSCKGLLLCCHSGISMRRRLWLDNTATKYIYNPATRQFVTLPPIQPARNMELTGFCLAYHPPKSHRYIVACCQRIWTPSENLSQLLVYSSETGCWRVSGAPFPLRSVNFHQAVYCHGAIHLIPTRNVSLCFDLDKELAREIPLPLPPCDSVVSKKQVPYFGESGGHLHLVQIFSDETTQFPIYEMERDCSGWSVKYRVDLTAVLPHPRICPYLLYLARGEKEEDSFFVMYSSGTLVRYNFANKATEEVMFCTNSRRELIQCNFSNQTHQVIGETTSKMDLFLGRRHVHPYLETLAIV